MSSKHNNTSTNKESFMWMIDLQHSSCQEQIICYSITDTKQTAIDNFKLELKKYNGYAVDDFLECLNYMTKYNQDGGVLKSNNKNNSYKIQFAMTKLYTQSGFMDITYQFHK